MSPTNPPGPGGSRPGKADWRGGKSKGAAAPARPAAKGAVWKDKPDQQHQRAKRRYRTKLGALVLLFFVLVGAFMWMVFFRLAKTPLLVLAATEYVSPALLPNAWAQEDADRFVALETEQQVRLHSVLYRAAPEEPLVGFQELRDEMKKYARGWWKRKTMIVYLSMHGAVNEKGEPCLIPPGSPPLDSRKWLTLREVIDYLFPPDVRESLPRNKLLILDCNRMDSNWRIGLLANDLAARLPTVVEEAAIPGLAILSSAGPGQIGWDSPEAFRGSVFGYYVFKGLLGSADREADGDDNGQVDSAELARYVRNNVRRWVQDHRADLQEPILIPERAESVERFPLVHALSKADLARVEARESKPPAGPSDAGAGQDAAPDESKKAAASASRRVTAEDLWSSVGDLWLEHERLERSEPTKPWNRDPLKWQEFQHRLLQQERWLMAGKACQDLARQNRAELERLAKELSRDPVAGACAAHSLPLAVWFSKDSSAIAAAEGLKKRWDAPPGKLDVPPGQPYVELHFLAMLRAYLDPPMWQQSPELIRQALAVRDLAEAAAAPPDERVHYWAWRPVEQADALRRLADDRLFVGTSAALQQAAASYAELAAPAGLYRTAQDRARKMRDAFEVRDRAWAKAPYLAHWLLARLREGEPTAEESRTTHLRTLLVGTRQLAAQLDQALDAELRRQQDPLLPGEAPPSVEETYQRVAAALAALEGDFAGRCTRLLEAGGEDRLVLKEISTVLAVPLATGQRRRELWDRYFKLATAGSGQERPAAGERGPESKQAPRPAEGESPSQRRLAAWMARWGEHPALAMLKFGPEPDSAAKPAGSDARLDPTLLWQQGGMVRVRLGGLNQEVVRHSERTESLQKSESETASPAEIRRGYSLADQAVRAYAPLLGTLVPLETGTRDDPIAQLRKLDFRYLQLWHAYRAIEDFWGPEPGNPAGKPFFQTAAEDYLRSARDLCPAAPVRRHGKTDLVELLKRRQAAAGLCVQPDVKYVKVFDPEVPAEVPMAASLAKDLPGGEAALLIESAAGRRPLPTFDKPVEARKKESEAPGQRRTGVPVQGDSWSRSQWIRSNDKVLEAQQFEAVALYRGHWREKRFTIVPFKAGYDIVWEPPRRQATVSVEGARKAASYVVFILDYSGSMDEDVGGETKGPAGAKTGTRYELARAGLSYLLKRLAKLPNNPYRVEVMLYGHRFGWTTAKLIQDWRFPPQTRTYTWDPQNPGSIIAADNLPGAVLPSEDVERIWPASWPPQHGLTEQETSKIEEILKRQRPVGDTPLYLAIQQAIRDLDTVPGNFAQPGAPSRHIVAITDGVNWQDFRRTDRLTGADVVEEALTKRPDIRLDVVGFLLSDDREEAKKQLQEDANQLRVDVENLVARYDELKGLVEKHKGRFYTVMDPTTLGARLEESLRLSRYVVYREEGGKPAGPKPAPKELGDSFDVPLPRPGPPQADPRLDWAGVPHAVELADSLLKARAQVWLRGEEGLRLYLSEDGQRLEHRFFDPEIREAKEFAHPRYPGRRLSIAAHEPRPEADGVHFRISVQNSREDAWQFSPRPLDGWIEVRPAPADAKPDDHLPLYVFYDLRFEPKQTTPVIECVVPDWPEGVHSAQVGLWCKFQGTDPDRSIPADEFARPQQVEGILLDLQFEPDEKQDQFRVLVTEQGHPADGQLNRFRVAMRPVPLRAVHRYVPEARTIRHTFVYPYAVRSDPRSSLLVDVTSRAKVLDGAIAVPKLTVAVPDRPR
jgi:Mg-chelatase subunit ChlD